MSAEDRALAQRGHAQTLLDEVLVRIAHGRCLRRQVDALARVVEALREAERELHEEVHGCPCGCELEGPVGGSAVGR